MRLSDISWITDAQRTILAEHNCETVAQLASLELVDSMADVVPVNNLRVLARRARATLGMRDPLEQIGAAAGQRGPVRYAGGQRYGRSSGG